MIAKKVDQNPFAMTNPATHTVKKINPTKDDGVGILKVLSVMFVHFQIIMVEKNGIEPFMPLGGGFTVPCATLAHFLQIKIVVGETQYN
jgi:hypothetical protein